MIDKTSRSSQHVNPLDAAVIAQGIQREVGDRITVVDSITSTNLPLLNERDRYPHGSVLFADHQTAGRGRRGKTWVSPPGVNVYLSIAWDWRHGLASIGGLSSAIGIAMIEALTRSETREELEGAARALDRLLAAGRYVIPFWHSPVSRIAYDSRLAAPEAAPLYGDWIGWMPNVWWNRE